MTELIIRQKKEVRHQQVPDFVPKGVFNIRYDSDQKLED